jgi:glycosyltransferase involved in cell wall biosynthesis
LRAHKPQAAAGGTHVTILMCTRNGEAFLQEQLDSLARQSHGNWRLVVSDDASVDGTRHMLTRFAGRSEPGRVEVRTRNRAVGAAANFMTLLADPGLAGDYFSCCDQDDIWWPDKLERALAALETVASSVPAVYFSRTRNVDATGRPVGWSPFFRKPPGFRNALVQSIGGGNTMVCNRAARVLLVAAGPVEVASHDWWTYLLVSGAGGVVHFDPVPSLDYRQHDSNHIGANRGLGARLRRLRMLADGQLTAWLDLHAAALERCAYLLTPENRKLLQTFHAMRSQSLAGRLAGWRALRPYRQSLAGQVGLFAALIANKI